MRDYNAFQCSGCQHGLRVDITAPANFGYLNCEYCAVYYPVLDGTPYFCEATIAPLLEVNQAQFVEHLIGDRQEYRSFLRQKSQRPNYEPYSAFQPFNESTRALFNLISEIKKHLKAGEPILDLWGRTAWSGEMLAAYFPDNPVYMVWEGNRNVLGYRGYDYWLNTSRRAENLHLVFTDIEKPLPFKTDFFGLVHGLDTFHRYSHNPLVGECLRVSKPSAPLVFPHIHLTNSEPDPYFDRGCKQFHGREYRAYLDKLQEATNRKAYMLSERALFEMTEKQPFADDSLMSHYNALLYIAPEGVEPVELSACHWPSVVISDDAKVILNPLITFDFNQSTTLINYQAMNGSATEMFERHPIYQKRLESVNPLSLTERQKKICFFMDSAVDVGDLARLTHIDKVELGKELEYLQSKEICTVLAVSKGMHALHKFYSQQVLNEYAQPDVAFRTLWESVLADPQHILLNSVSQNIKYTSEDIQQVVSMVVSKLNALPANGSRRVMLCSEHHVEALIVIWACWLAGFTVVPVYEQWADTSLQEIANETLPILVFVDAKRAAIDGVNALQIHFDSLSDDHVISDAFTFSTWLEKDDERVSEYQVRTAVDNQQAAILFTSGTTGKPKGVVHSFANLLRGAQKLSRFYQLESLGTVLSFAGIHAMSGLRNAAVLPLLNKQTLILPDQTEANAVSQCLNIIEKHRPELIVSSPALIESVAALQSRCDNRLLAPIQTWLCTGTKVSNEVLCRLSQQLDIRFESYYGLTETGGFCAGTQINKSSTSLPLGSIGVPYGALLEILDDDKQPCEVGQIGQLVINSDQLMVGRLVAGRLNKEELSVNGYATGDLAMWDKSGQIVLLGREDQQYKTPAGDIVHLSYLTSKVQREFSDCVFVAIHDFTEIKIVLEHAESSPGGTLENNFIDAFRRAASTNIGEISVVTIPKIPVNSNDKFDIKELNKRFFA